MRHLLWQYYSVALNGCISSCLPIRTSITSPQRSTPHVLLCSASLLSSSNAEGITRFLFILSSTTWLLLSKLTATGTLAVTVVCDSDSIKEKKVRKLVFGGLITWEKNGWERARDGLVWLAVRNLLPERDYELNLWAHQSSVTLNWLAVPCGRISVKSV